MIHKPERSATTFEQNNPVRDVLARYDWYHCIEIAPGIRTPGIEAYLPIQHPVMEQLRRCDLRNKRVLDVGCRDGLFSFEAERMGAAEVVGIDNDLSPGAVEFLIPYFGSSIRMRALNLYDLIVPSGEQFDFVLCAGVLYHLRFPFFGLKRIADAMRAGAELLLETAIWATGQSLPLLYCPAPADSPYDPTSVSFYNHAGMTAALGAMGFVDVKCCQILSNDGRLYAGWEQFRDRYLDDSKIMIVRGVYTATKSSVKNEHLSAYWYASHTLNSVHADDIEFKAQFGR